MSKGTLAYSDILTVGDDADCSVEPEWKFDTLSDKEEEETADQTDIERDKEVKAKDIYFVALEIWKLQRDNKGINAEWPSDSHDLTLTRAKESILVMLYNFLAWSVGFTCDPTMDKNSSEISCKEDAKVISIAQDLIYAESKGKKHTYKSLALGMAVRQITRSVRLLKVLHCLGHKASTDTVSKHDTTLAIISSNGDGKAIKIPMNISKTYLAQLSGTTTTLSKRHLKPRLFHSQVKKKGLYPYVMRVSSYRLKKKAFAVNRLWPEMPISCIYHREERHQRKGNIGQDGQGSTPTSIKRSG